MKTAKEIFYDLKRKKIILMSVLILLIFFAFVLSLCFGAVSVAIPDVLRAIGHALLPDLISPTDRVSELIIMRIRLPRALMTIVTGISLGVAGTVMQGTLRNPLVSPFTLGLSSAAAFGASLMIVVGPAMFGSLAAMSVVFMDSAFSSASVLRVLSAFGMGLVSMGLVLVMTRIKRMTNSTMILAGVVLSYLFQAGIMFLKYISSNSELRDVTMWMMGGFGSITWATFILVTPIVSVCTVMLMRQSMRYNALSCGDDVARNLGVNVNSLKRTSLLIVAVSVSACMAFTGVIGFIGLMAPHMCRMIIGNDHKYLIPCSAMMGAFILLLSDLVGRVVAAPEELPVGVIMYILGGIFFIYLICKGRGRGID